jgi:sugar lactone lactonase YvrE
MISLVVVSLLAALAIVLAYVIWKNQKPLPTERNALGKVATLAGTGYPGFADGANHEAAFCDPFGVAVDSKGNIIIADAGASNRIRRITAQGRVETLAGSDEGFADGPAQAALFNTPSGIAVDEDDNLIIADTSNNRIRKLDAKGQVTTLAGSGARGIKDGQASEATFDAPVGVAVDAKGNVYVADTYNDCIRKIATDGQVTTLAGTGVAGYKDGQVSEAMFDTPCGIAVDQLGNVYVADTGNRAIRKITAQGDVITIAGGTKDVGDVLGGEVHYSRPAGITVTHDGFLFVADQGNDHISQIHPDGEYLYYAGWKTGFADGTGIDAKFNSPAGIALDKQGNLYVADSQNYLIRKLEPTPQNKIREPADYVPALDSPGEDFIQPHAANPASQDVDNGGRKNDLMIPRLDKETLHINAPFLWPLQPQNSWHEVAGVVGEVRGWFNGEARDHLHSGLDIAGKMGEPCLSIMDEKVSAPIANWGYNDTGEGLRVGLMSYIHIRIGRDGKDQIQVNDKFKPRFDETGKMMGVRVRRGTRFRQGDFIGTLNRLYHVHMNLGPRNAEANAIQFPFIGFKDTVAPVIEPNGIEVMTPDGRPFKEKANGRLKVTGDVIIAVTAYDLVDGNNPTRKLGLYRVGYQLLHEDGSPAQGFEQPLINIEFNRLPAAEEAVKIVYAEGSGVSAYGTPTKFKYVVTNRVRDGEARRGVLRTSMLKPGNYIVKVIAEDYSGNRATGKATELAITIQ